MTFINSSEATNEIYIFRSTRLKAEVNSVKPTEKAEDIAHYTPYVNGESRGYPIMSDKKVVFNIKLYFFFKYTLYSINNPIVSYFTLWMVDYFNTIRVPYSLDPDQADVCRA